MIAALFHDIVALFGGAATMKLVLGATLLAGMVRGSISFGAAFIMTPAYILVMSPPVAVLMTQTVNLVAGLQIYPSIRRQVDWPTTWRLLIPTLVAIPIGGALVVIVDERLARLVIASAVIVIAGLMLAGYRYRGPVNRGTDIAVGSASGLLTGIGGIGGPPFLLYLLAGKLSAEEVRATSIPYFTISNVAAILTFAVAGVIDSGVLIRLAVLLPVYMIAVQTGLLFFRFLRGGGDAVLRKIMLVTILVINVVIVYRSL